MKIYDGHIPSFPHIDGKGYSFPTFIEVKIDGEANIYAKGVLMSKASGKIRNDFPVTDILRRIVDDDTILFGELHWGDGKAGALYDFLSHAKDDKLNFTIFDVHHPTLADASYMTRREWIINNILYHPVFVANVKGDNAIRITRSVWIEDDDALNKAIQQNKEDGWEGLVIKDPGSILYHSATGLHVSQTLWVKVKHRYTCDCKVARIDPTLERMDVIVDYLDVGKGMTQRLVGVKLVNKYKPFVKEGDIVEIEHMGQLAQGGLRHPNFKGKVIPKEHL